MGGPHPAPPEVPHQTHPGLMGAPSPRGSRCPHPKGLQWVQGGHEGDWRVLHGRGVAHEWDVGHWGGSQGQRAPGCS